MLPRRLLLPRLSLPALLCLLPLASCGGEEEGATPPGDTANNAANNAENNGACVPTQRFFNEEVWAPVLSTQCIACHNPQGQARTSRLVLIDATQPGYLERNLAIVEDVAGLERGGVSLLLLKPTGADNHGGGPQIQEGDASYQALEALVDRFKNPVECEDDTPVAGLDDVILMDPQATLRKATLTLAGRLPSDAEIARVREGGEPALEEVLDEVMREEAFTAWIKEVWNDHLLTNRYVGRNDAVDLLNDEDYPDRYWHEELEDTGVPEEFINQAKGNTNRSVAQEALELIAHVVREDRPFTEILTADYTLVNYYSARVYGVAGSLTFDDPTDPKEWREARIPGVPHAGVLTSPMWLNRFPTTATNVNRHRARMVYRFFLATDVLRLAERPVDPASVAGHNPTMNDANCAVCHATIDPVAGTFQNWTASGRYSPPEDGWYPELRSPGFGDEVVPWEERFNSLQWLAEKIAADRRFVTSSVYIMFQGLTGQKPLPTPTDRTSPLYNTRLKQFEDQEQVLSAVGDAMIEDGYNIKAAVKRIVLSPYFRAINADPSSDERAEELAEVGAARFLPPELLHRKIEAVLGYPWREGYNNRSVLTSSQDYLIFYGGIDSDSVTERITDPNGIMANVGQRMANHMACVAGPRDFTLPQAERRLFKLVEPAFIPEDENGFEIPQAVSQIKANIQYLHEYLLGERLAVTDPEIERTYQLFLETFREGAIGIAEAGYSDRLPSSCRVTRDFWTGEDLPQERRLEQDPHYTVRAWMAVLSYLLSDFRFLFE